MLLSLLLLIKPVLIDQNKIKKKITLPEFAQEGITFDNKANIYFADDDGAVMKYSLKELGL